MLLYRRSVVTQSLVPLAFEINESSKTVKRENITIELTFKEFKLLHYLATKGIVLSREKNIEQCLGYQF
jgi:DNA-binding response OmpR family regulator